ncbi:MAG: hypothetical protein BGO67_07655 [Alphaproteobacteria bacterium 41-28]|nr:MAG: hypothetical protein BGO67_07655 [Alphaproteobacteria bacterium 41-28]
MKNTCKYLFVIMLPFLSNGIAKAEANTCSESCQKGYDACFDYCKQRFGSDAQACNIGCYKARVECSK